MLWLVGHSTSLLQMCLTSIQGRFHTRPPPCAKRPYWLCLAEITLFKSTFHKTHLKDLYSSSCFACRLPGKWGILFPLSLYATPTLISSSTSRMSSFVNAMLFEGRQKELWMEYSAKKLAKTSLHTYAVKPLIMCAYLTMTRSNHPQRLFLPVVTPTSWPLVCSSSPTAWSTKEKWHVQY